MNELDVLPTLLYSELSICSSFILPCLYTLSLYLCIYLLLKFYFDSVASIVAALQLLSFSLGCAYSCSAIESTFGFAYLYIYLIIYFYLLSNVLVVLPILFHFLILVIRFYFWIWFHILGHIFLLVTILHLLIYISCNCMKLTFWDWWIYSLKL